MDMVQDECGVYLYVCDLFVMFVCGLHQKRGEVLPKFSGKSTRRACSIFSHSGKSTQMN
jgi:hypothetical protein